MKTFPQSPYFDDYSENKKFYQVLTRPSYPLQARELQTIQSILQRQIESLGDHFFKEGAKIIDGQMSFDTDVTYVKIRDGYTTNIERLVGMTLTGNYSGTKATVVAVSLPENGDPATLFVKFVSSDTKNFTDTWSIGEIITEYSDIQIQDTKDAIGKGSIATIERGVYYVKGYFVLVESQSIVLDKYSNVPTYRVGLSIKESVVTPEQDSSLLDNAMGSSNYSAPGAHRYHIELTLSKVALSAKIDSDNFVELGQIQSGSIVKQVTSTEYNELEATLARRTYDESGDYTVRPFKVSVREHRNNDRGQWKVNTEYKVGDIVRNFGHAYVAKTKGKATSGTGPVAVVGTEVVGEVEWEYVANPPLNNGVYNAEGKVVRIEILDGGNGYVSQPSISFSSESNVGVGAKATAIISGGKVVEVIIDDAGEGYVDQTLKMKFVGGHASNSDKNASAEEESDATAIAYTNAGNPDKLSIGIEGGKAYVQGFELEKLGTTWVDVNKSRTYDEANNVLLMPKVGNYFRVQNISGEPPLIEDKDNTIELYDQIEGGNVIGTARVRGIEPEGDNVYKMFVYDIAVKNGKSISANVKHFESKGGFKATIEPIATILSGDISVNGVGEVVVNGHGSTFKTQLKVGDYILCNDRFVRVVGDITQNSFKGFVEGTEPLNAQNAAYYMVTTEICEPQGISCVYDLPHSCVKSTSIGEIDYFVTYNSTETSDSSGNVTFQCDNATFASTDDSDNYLLLDEDGKPVSFTTPSYTKGSRNITLKVTNHENGKRKKYTLLATLHKLGNNVGLGVKKSVAKTIPRVKQSEVTSQIIKLDVVDAYKLVSVKMYPNVDFGASTLNATEYVDITDRYTFHDGQTNSHYGQSYIKLKGGYNAPEHPITIEFFYFEREVEGDYYTVQSYDVNYGDIPFFNGRRLSDVIDFRPDIDKNGIPTKSSMVKRGTEIQLSYNYYLARTDKICIDYLGNIVVVEGISSLNPQIPDSPSLSMDICNVELSPYTFDTSTSNVNIELIDNKRYTMRDIGRLDRRITNLEEFTTLSLLEVQTEALMIRDSDNYDRFKNGFVVDNFGSTLLLNTDDEGCNCAIDTKAGVCRPPFTSKNVSLFEYLENSSTRDDSNYMLYGKLLTLPLDDKNPHVAIVEQPLATQIQNVNPFAIVSFVGNLTVNPSSDDWFETKYLPDVINNVEGNYLSTKNALEGTKWNSWQVTWTGEKVATDKTVTTTSTGRAGRDLTTYTTTTTTYAQQQGQSRSGVKTTVTSTTDYELVGDRLVSTTNIPYMRSRWLLVRAFNLKPYTRYIPKFDNVNVDYWCVPASKIEITNLRGKFDSTSGAGFDSNSEARKIETTKNSYWAEMTDRTCLDVGDVIVGKSSNNTAVVVGTSFCTMEKDRKNFSDCLYVVNIKSPSGKTLEGREYENGYLKSESLSFEPGETISALNSISGAEAMVGGMDGEQISERYTVEGNKNHKYDELITNGSGELYFMFWIPDKDMVDYTSISSDVPVFQFKCGDRVLSLHEEENASSSGQAVYSAVGILNTRQKSINAIRNAVVSQQTVSENRTVTNTSSTTNTVKRYLDPLAQSFVIGDAVSGGCFLSKVDIYFATKPNNDNPLPITLQIRTVENGVPTGKVLPFASVTLRPDQVNISETMVSYVDSDGRMVTTAMYDTPTTFEFESPVYVEDTSEYAIVLLSDSNNYNVWIAQLGATIPGKETIVSKQPHMGVLFKSQNASTWSPIQNQDLMFTLYRANFKVSDKSNQSKYIGTVEFASKDLEYHYLPENAFQTAKDSSLVRVWDFNHGLLENMEVKFEVDDINAIDNSKLLTGSINTSDKVTYVKGVGTRFFYEVKDNDVLYDNKGKKLGTVAYVSNNNELYLKSNAEASYEGQYTKAYEEETLNGIPLNTLLRSSFRVLPGSANINSYIIDVGEKATTSGYCGGKAIKSNYVLNYDVIQPNFAVQNFSDTSVSYKIKTITGTSAGSSSQVETPFYPIVENENNVLVEPMAIYNNLNNVSTLKDVPSLVFSVSMSSSNSCLSPVIDTDRMSAILINNTFDDPSEDTINNEELDVNPIISNQEYGFCGVVSGCETLKGVKVTEQHTITVSNPEIEGGKVAEVSLTRNSEGVVTSVEVDESGYGYTKAPIITVVDNGTTKTYTADYTQNCIYTENVDNIVSARECREGEFVEIRYERGNNVFAKVEDVVTDENVLFIFTDTDLSGMTVEKDSVIVRRAAFIDETAPVGGTVLAKYITKPISFANSCNYLRIMMAMCVPQSSNVDVYYKAYQNGGSKQYGDVSWVLVNPTNGIKKVEVGSDVFTDVEYDVEYKDGENIPSFDVVAVKVVFRGTNTSAVPKIKDLRIIACE